VVRILSLYAASLVAVAALDFLWLGVIARGWYQGGIGHLMADKPNLVAAAAFYLLYPVGLLIFAVLPSGGDWGRAMLMGALFGLFAYGTYDLTNLAILRDWPLGITVLDIGWGAVVSAVGAGAGALSARWLAG
jgi:uncharacterized membrane protein